MFFEARFLNVADYGRKCCRQVQQQALGLETIRSPAVARSRTVTVSKPNIIVSRKP